MTKPNEATSSALDRQVGGDHYLKGRIQPIEFIQAQRLGFIEGSVVKYVTRWRNKNGIEDLKKARQYLDILIELETSYPSEPREDPMAGGYVILGPNGVEGFGPSYAG